MKWGGGRGEMEERVRSEEESEEDSEKKGMWGVRRSVKHDLRSCVLG